MVWRYIDGLQVSLYIWPWRRFASLKTSSGWWRGCYCRSKFLWRIRNKKIGVFSLILLQLLIHPFPIQIETTTKNLAPSKQIQPTNKIKHTKKINNKIHLNKFLLCRIKKLYCLNLVDAHLNYPFSSWLCRHFPPYNVLYFFLCTYYPRWLSYLLSFVWTQPSC